ncbi:unnamed protein product [Rhizoctonia solani]|uniref:L-lysine 6-oxidase n=1 Tax=Rhizoctonia solani TaxID=456999 RepID=A0A8H3GJV0_9AGAM|nr:unnamed protein product [Rhizoctonia solani]
MPFSPDQIEFVDIYPPINVARVGDSDEYFIGTENPGVEPIPDGAFKDYEWNPTGGFKDKDYKIRKHAARFRVYAFDKDSKVLGEITSKDYSLTWTTHVANKKAAWIEFHGKYGRDNSSLRNPGVQGWPGEPGKWPYDYTNERSDLIIDSGEQSIQGENAQPVALQGVFQGSTKSGTQVQLGELRTDDQGRLLVLASDGHSFSILGDKDLTNGFDNPDWVDKMCDGSVRVTVKSKSKPELNIPVKNRATIMTAPPRFASGTHCPTTLYELIEEVYEQPKRGEGYDVGDVVYYEHIYPLFDRGYLMSWTNRSANQGHGPTKIGKFQGPNFWNPEVGKDARVQLFNDRIRLYVIDGDKANQEARNAQANGDYMPRLSGDAGDVKEGVADKWASLTQLQYDRLKKWSLSEFTTGKQEEPYKSFDDIPLDKQPDALIRSGCEWGIGAALYPGIETFWISQFPEMYNLKEKFRHADTVKPGDLTKGLCLPWQSDFNMCQKDWWPSVRPDDVVTEAYFQQVKAVTPPDQLAKKLTKRERWDRGIAPRKDEGNSGMVDDWNKLGFVARQIYETQPDQLKILVERERNPNFPPPQGGVVVHEME